MPKKECPKERCSFCERSKDDVQKSKGKLIAGSSGAYICDECVELICYILADNGFDKFRLSSFDKFRVKQMNNE